MNRTFIAGMNPEDQHEYLVRMRNFCADRYHAARGAFQLRWLRAVREIDGHLREMASIAVQHWAA